MPPVRSLPPPSANIKKRKNSTSAVAERIVILENELSAAIGSGTSLNALADLLDIATTIGEDAQVVSKTIYAIYRTVVLLVSAGHLTPGGDEDAKLVRTWIWERLNTFVDLLCGLLKDDDKTLRVRV
jgi:U3 small nucleolar RNA-associated protein 19